MTKATKAAPKAKAPKPATEKVTSRSAGYSKGEIAAPKPSKIVADATAKKAALDKAAKADAPAPAKRVNPDIITTSQSLTSGGKPGEYVVSNGKENIVILNNMRGEVRKLAVIGGSLKAVRAYIAEHKPDAKLAHGVTARTSPNAAKAASDQRKPASRAPATNNAGPAAKVGTKGQTQTAKAAPAKPDRKPNITTDGKRKSGQAYGGKVEDTMSITVVSNGSPYKAGTKADATFGLFGKSKTVADFRKLVAKSPDKYDAGYIRYAARDGFIRLG